MLLSGTGGQSGTRLPTRETWPFVALLYEDKVGGTVPTLYCRYFTRSE